MFSGNIERDQWHKIGSIEPNKEKKIDLQKNFMRNSRILMSHIQKHNRNSKKLYLRNIFRLIPQRIHTIQVKQLSFKKLMFLLSFFLHLF